MKYPAHDPTLPVVAVDFDGVLASPTWPSSTLGTPDWKAIDMAHHYHEKGCEIVVHTARPDSHHERIWAWLRNVGLNGVIYDVTRIKPVACLYFDDRAVRWPLK